MLLDKPFFSFYYSKQWQKKNHVIRKELWRLDYGSSSFFYTTAI